MESSAAQMVATTAAAGENDRAFDRGFRGFRLHAEMRASVPLCTCMTARPCPFILFKSCEAERHRSG